MYRGDVFCTQELKQAMPMNIRISKESFSYFCKKRLEVFAPVLTLILRHPKGLNDTLNQGE